MPTTFRPYGPDRMPVPDVRDRLPERHLAHRVGHLVTVPDPTVFTHQYDGAVGAMRRRGVG